MKIPSLFYGKPGKVASRVRKLAKTLVTTRDFAHYDPGPFVDTKEVDGVIYANEPAYRDSSAENFHCYLLSEALSDASPQAEVHNNLHEWLMASLDEEWRFMCTLGGSSREGLWERGPEVARRYLEAAARHWPAMARERERFVPREERNDTTTLKLPSGPITYKPDILISWNTLAVALQSLGFRWKSAPNCGFATQSNPRRYSISWISVLLRHE